MTKKTKIGLIVAACLLLAGAALIGIAIHIAGGDFMKLSTVKYNTTEHMPAGEFRDILIETDTADIAFVPAEATKVVCYEQKNAKHTVSLENGVLTIRIVDNRKWYEHIGINFGAPKITVYIPQGAYGALTVKSSTGDVKLPKDFTFEAVDITESTGNVTTHASVSGDVKIKTSTGDISVANISAGSLELAVSTGKIIVLDVTCQGDMTVNVSTGKTGLTNVKCQNFTSNGSTGDLSLENVIAAEKFCIERSTGDVDFEKCDAAEITVKTDTGHIKGSLLSEKVFIARTDTGRVDVPHTTTGGKCQLTTDTGDIKIEIK